MSISPVSRLVLSAVLVGIISLVMFNEAESQVSSQEFFLWQGPIPDALAAPSYKERHDKVKDHISNVVHPTITVFAPERPNGSAVVICPGGAYAILAITLEGYSVAGWFNTLGVTAFVLKSRLPSDAIMANTSVGPLQDVQEAIRFVRRNAAKWNINPDRIGVTGFSAGGHLAASASTMFDDKVYPVPDNVSARPDFSVLIYPVISMLDGVTHGGSRYNLLGNSPSKAVIERMSAELRVNKNTPPAFLVHTLDDDAVPAENSIRYAKALVSSGVPAELHLYQSGGHGFGLGKTGTSTAWTKACEAWLQLNGFLPERN